MNLSNIERFERFLLLRRPLLLAVVLGCGISLLTSGRFTLRLIVDGTISFAFVPLCELVAFAIVYRLQRGTRSIAHPAEGGHQTFAQAADRYFAGNTPWLWWLVALMAVTALLPARRLGSLLAPLLFTSPIPIALSVRFDLLDRLSQILGLAGFAVLITTRLR